MLKLKDLNRKVRHLFKRLRLEEPEVSFLRHNKRIWHNFVVNKGDGEILVESYKIAASIMAFSYFANILARKYSARIKAYHFGQKPKSLESKIRRWNHDRKYESFNAETLYCRILKSQLLEVEKLFNEIYPTLRSKKDVEDLKAEGVWIGDLLYDSHLMRYRVPTIEIQDWRFHSSLREALGYYVYWRDYFDSHNVKSIVVSHCVYAENAIPLRLAIKKGIPAYQVNSFSLYRLSQERLWAYTEFFDFPEQFKELNPEEQKAGLRCAKENVERRLSGEVGVDMYYSSKSAFTKATPAKRILTKSSRIKILVAAHCFFDAPHPFGVNLFPDFYEWVTFLGRISEKTDYDWYIKTHPDFLPGNDEILEEIIRKYPRFTLLPKETSHLQIVMDGIDFVLTVYGTVGVEYAALGVSVINASMCNQSIAYNFNIHPKTIQEYEDILLNLAEQKLDIDINKVYEYYCMNFIHDYGKNWLVEHFIDRIGGYPKQNEPEVYRLFLDEFSEQRHEKTLRTLRNFIESGDYCFQRSHYSDYKEAAQHPVKSKIQDKVCERKKEKEFV